MKLYESAEDYLEKILMLQEKIGQVHAIDIAREMGFSKPSVSVAVHKLEDNGYIVIGDDGVISFTNLGKEVATKVYERHVTISKVLMMIGVSKEQAMIDACKVEHDLSEETFSKLKEALSKNGKVK